MYGYDGGIKIEISIPQGVELAKKTFNPRLGIEGGISVLGTSGIVEPMSEQALLDTIELEMKVRRAGGKNYLIMAPGNYGLDFLREAYGIQDKDVVKCSNYIGQSMDMAADCKFQGLVHAGHIGKLIKVWSDEYAFQMGRLPYGSFGNGNATGWIFRRSCQSGSGLRDDR